MPATRVNDIPALNLETTIQKNLENSVFVNRMLWELWMESANSFENLKQNLRKRGYSGLPIHSVLEKKEPTQIKNTVKSMVRRTNR